MHMVINLVDKLGYFKQKSHDGSLCPCGNCKILAQSQLSSEKKRVCIQSFSFSTVAIDMHGKLAQGFIIWE